MTDNPDWLEEDEDEQPDWLAEVEEDEPEPEPVPDKPSYSSSSSGSSYGGNKSKSRYGNSRGSKWDKSSQKKEEVSYRDMPESEIPQAKKDRLRKRAMNICMYQLGQRAMPSAKLRERMIKKDLPDFIIEEIIQKLIDMELVNDEEFARTFIQSKRENQRRGDFRIAMELQRKGFDREYVQELMDEEPENNTPTEEERALDLARSKVRSSRGLDRQKRFNRLTGLLARNGFGGGIFGIVNQVLTEDEEEEQSEQEDQ